MDQTDSITYNNRYDFYEVPPLKLSILDYWARKGITSDVITEGYKELIDQITLAKVQADQIIIQHQRRALRDSTTIMALNRTIGDCSETYNKERETTKALEKELNKETNRKGTWKVIALIEGALIAIAVFIGASS